MPASPHGYVGQGLGQAVSAGAPGLIAPTRYVEKPIEDSEKHAVGLGDSTVSASQMHVSSPSDYGRLALGAVGELRK